MKKFDFSFECNNNFEKMPATGNTRYCDECSRHIVDLTKLSPKEIVEYKKEHKNPCGFMMPWQIDQMNEYLQQINNKPSSFTKYAKIAAVVSSPLLFNTAIAQKNVASTEVVSVDKKGKTGITEILVKDSLGDPLTLLDLDLYEGSVFIKSIKTDSLGKIYLNSVELSGKTSLILKNTDVEIEKEVMLNRHDQCIVWETKITKADAEKTKQIDFQFVLKSKKNEKPCKHSAMEISLYDSTNTLIETIKCKSNMAGYALIKTKKLTDIDHLYFVVYTDKGRRTSHMNIKEISVGEVTKISFYYSSRRHRRPQVMGKF